MNEGSELYLFLYKDSLLVELAWPFPDNRFPDPGTNGLGLGIIRKYVSLPDDELGNRILTLLSTARPVLAGLVPTTSLSSLSELSADGMTDEEVWQKIDRAVMVQSDPERGMSVAQLRVDRKERYQAQVTDRYEMLGHEATSQAVGSSVRRLLSPK
mgnify:CR=1 FL=1